MEDFFLNLIIEKRKSLHLHLNPAPYNNNDDIVNYRAFQNLLLL